MDCTLSESIFFWPRTRVVFFFREVERLPEAVWVAVDFVLVLFELILEVVPGFVVVAVLLGAALPASVLDACGRAFATPVQAHAKPNAQAAPNHTFRAAPIADNG
jgi:hypothetical protein